MKKKSILLKLIFLFLIGNQFSNAQTTDSSHKNWQDFVGKYNHSIFGENVFVFEPQMKMAEIQTILDTIYNRQATKKSEFNKNRYSIFFKQGTYTLDVKVGYYMQVYGLGQSPDDVVIIGAVRSKSTSKQGHVLSNFWRSAENLTVIPTIDSACIWGVSQAAPLRRVHIKGNLQLHDGGYASGGFIADSKIDGMVFSGNQQQWFSRNTNWGKWIGGNWNMMFMGVPNAPIGNWPEKPYTVIKETPLVREKPYLIYDEQGFGVKIPKIRQNSVGSGWENNIKDDKTLRLKDFYLVTPNIDNSESMNAALKKGKNLLLTPGIYSIDKALKVNRPGTIILGIGMATMQSTNGNSILEISDIDGVTLSGLILDAGKAPSETLLRVGESNSKKSHQTNPTFLFDVYCRVGGPFEGSTASCMIINSRNVYIDNTWLWRADHGTGVGWDKNKSANGLIVNGDNVTIYGLFNEHFQEYQTLWNGNNGKVYFYQSEMPYDPPTVDAWKHDGIGGYASYKVADSVKSHEAWGVGVYCVFHHAPIIVDNAIETPKSLERNMHHTVTFWLNGNKESIIKNIINGKGDSVNVDNKKATLE